MNLKTALVTGATGFVGSHVAQLLLDDGYEVRVLARPTSDRRNIPKSPGIQVVEGDLRDLASLKEAVRGCGEVYHVAADYRFWAPDPRELYESNVQGTQNLLEAGADAGVRKFVHTSTVGTIGLAAQPNACNEQTPLKPKQLSNHYKLSKWEAEQIALDYAKRGFPVVIVNPSTPIGAGDCKPTPTGRIIVDFINGKMPAYMNTGLNFVHVRDVARGHLLAARHGKVGARYILGHQNLTMLQFLELLGELAGRSAPKVRIPYSMAYMAGAVSTAFANYISKRAPAIPLEAVKMSKHFMFFDPSRARDELGIPQTPVREAAAEALTWFTESGYFKNTPVFNFR
jgi:dihydroflavonol-4-reductase